MISRDRNLTMSHLSQANTRRLVLACNSTMRDEDVKRWDGKVKIGGIWKVMRWPAARICNLGFAWKRNCEAPKGNLSHSNNDAWLIRSKGNGEGVAERQSHVQTRGYERWNSYGKRDILLTCT